MDVRVCGCGGDNSHICSTDSELIGQASYTLLDIAPMNAIPSNPIVPIQSILSNRIVPSITLLPNSDHIAERRALEHLPLESSRWGRSC